MNLRVTLVRGRADLLCLVPVLVPVVPKQRALGAWWRGLGEQGIWGPLLAGEKTQRSSSVAQDPASTFTHYACYCCDGAALLHILPCSWQEMSLIKSKARSISFPVPKAGRVQWEGNYAVRAVQHPGYRWEFHRPELS